MAEDRWQDLVAGAVGGSVTEGAMFGSKGLHTGKKFFAMWWHEQLVVKLPAERAAELAGAGQAQPFEPMPGRAMTGWVVVAGTSDWPPLVDEARAFVAAQNA